MTDIIAKRSTEINEMSVNTDFNYIKSELTDLRPGAQHADPALPGQVERGNREFPPPATPRRQKRLKSRAPLVGRSIRQSSTKKSMTYGGLCEACSR